MENLISVENLTREFQVGKKVVTALKDVNLSVKQGEFTIFQGPSGSGKTTMMNILGALDRPSRGAVHFESQDISLWGDKERDHLRKMKMGFIFQSIALISLMSAYENVDFGMRIAHVPPDERERRVEECLSLVGLKKRMHHMPQEMSGGEQQRVAIARAIAHNPSIILADEPTSDLDSKTSLQVIKLFKDLISEQGVTIVMTSHNPSIIELGDSVYTFIDGVVEKTK